MLNRVLAEASLILPLLCCAGLGLVDLVLNGAEGIKLIAQVILAWLLFFMVLGLSANLHWLMDFLTH